MYLISAVVQYTHLMWRNSKSEGSLPHLIMLTIGKIHERVAAVLIVIRKCVGGH